MGIREFTGELDAASTLKPFDGELDDEARKPLPIDVTPSPGGRGSMGATAEQAVQRAPVPRRGGTRAEAAPFVGGDTRVPAPVAPTSVFETTPIPDDIAPPPLTDSEMLQNSISPERQQRERAIAAYGDTTRSPEARPFTPAQNIGQDVREATDNPIARGAAAGFSQLGQIGTGALRAGADVLGAEGIADFASRASGGATAVADGATRDLAGNDKLVASVTSSIINSVPAIALGTVGGPALRTLFAQSAAADYAETGNAAHAGIMGAAEALGERFGFSEQLRLLKGVVRGMPADETARVLGALIAKEIPGEQATTALQFLADKMGPGARNQNATFADYLAQAGETLEVTIAQTGVMGGGPAAISTGRAQMAKTDAATERAAMSVPERAAKDAGFLRPTEQRKQIHDAFDDYVATHAMPPKAVKAIKEAAENVPLAQLPGFIKRAAQALAKRGLFRGPVDDDALAGLDAAPPPQVDSAVDNAPAQGSQTPGALEAADLLDDGSGLAEPPQRTAVDDAAHQAATSHENDRKEPTKAQQDAGNYALGHPTIAGMGFSVENADTSTRRGVDEDGTPWETTMQGAHYGYWKGTTAFDSTRKKKQGVDGFIVAGTPEDYSGPMFVIDQVNPKTGKFDEHKTVSGAATAEQAEAVYRAHYADDWQGFGSITQLPMPAFKAWVYSDQPKRGPIGDLNGQPNLAAAPELAARPSDERAPDIDRGGRAVGPLADDAAGRMAATAQAPVRGSADAVPARSGPVADEALSAHRILANAGRTPNSTEPLTLRANADGTLTPHLGKDPLVDYESGKDVVLPGNVTDLDAKKAIRKAGAISNKVNFYPSKEAAAALQQPAKAAAPQKPSRLTTIDDARMQTESARQLLEEIRPDIGWDQVGGKMIRSGEAEAGDGGMGGAVVGRTPWVGSDLWRNRKAAGADITEADANAAINNALAGKPMTERQKRFVRYVLDTEGADDSPRQQAKRWRAEDEAERAAIMAENAIGANEMAAIDDTHIDWFDQTANTEEFLDEIAQAALDSVASVSAEEAREDGPEGEEAPARAGEDAPGGDAEGLTAQTSADLEAKAAREAAATKADTAEQKRLADKAKADSERDEFTLTGSDRAADVAAAAGQRGMFDEPADAADEPTPNYKAGDRILPGTDVFEGDVVRYDDATWMAKVKRGNTIPLHPIAGGKPQVNADSLVRVDLTEHAVTHTGMNVYGYGGQMKFGESLDVPANVRNRLRIALDGLRREAEKLDGVLRARGKGEILAIELRDQQDDIRRYRGTVNEFIGKAANLGINADAIIREEGGVEDFARFGESAKKPVTPQLTPPARAAKSPAVAEAAKIADFGQKLEGARKDYAASLKDAMERDVAAEPLSKSWPEPDYQKLLDGGADPFMVAFIHAARDEIQTKPQKGWKLKGWVQSVEMLRGMSQKLLSGTITSARVQEMLAADEFRTVRNTVGGRAELYQLVGHEHSLKGISYAEHHYSLYRGQQDVRKWVVEQKAKATMFSNWPRELAVADTKAEMLAQFKAKIDSLDLGREAKKQTQFVIYRKRGEPGAFVGKKIGREHIDLHKAADVEAARKYLAENVAQLETALAKYKDTPFERNAENRPRVGDDHRNGAPVTPEVFAETFGFRGVQFGNYVEQGRRQSDLNEAYDSLMDLAAVLGVAPRALSLNGQLGLAFGARGSGGKNAPAAHFEPDRVVINLTKGSGPGSLAHEWWHSLDNHFAKRTAEKSTGFVTEGAADTTLRVAMRAAFNAVKAATSVASLRARSMELDKRRSKPYWNTPAERSARAFESYVIAKLQDQSATNDYLANIVSKEVWDVVEEGRAKFITGGKAVESYPYPTVDELPAVRTAFDEFFKTVETREDDAGSVVMFSQAQNSEEMRAWHALSENDDLFALPKSRATTVEDIARDIDPKITVEAHPAEGLDRYTLTMPNGDKASVFVRSPSPYGPHRYGKAAEHLPDELVRPGEDQWTMRDVDDVWIDVSKLKPGGGGALVYAIAGDFAHNTERVFIGDPVDVSAAAMSRRPEAMLSSALRWGTTEHLAPHPKQVAGNKALGVPPLKWVQGDDLDNIRRLIDLNLKALENATDASDRLTFDSATGIFRDGTGEAVQIARGTRETSGLGGYPRAARALAGSRTLARAAVWNSLLREGGGEGQGAGRRDGLLARFARLADDRPQALEGLFAEGSAETTDRPSTVASATAEIASLFGDSADGVVTVAATVDDLPAAVAALVRKAGATGVTLDKKHVYIVADRVTQGTVRGLVMHELGVHYGMDKAEVATLTAQVKRWATGTGTLAEQARLALRAAEQSKSSNTDEEALAHMVQALVDSGVTPQTAPTTMVRRLLNAVLDAIKAAAKALGLTLNVSPQDIVNYAYGAAKMALRNAPRAKRAVESRTEFQDTQPGVMFLDTRFSTAGKGVDSEAFQRWFKGSKVVDEDGEPLRVYHGTPASFDSFKPGTGWFAATPGEANFWGGMDKDGANIMPAYLSIKKPRVMQAGDVSPIQISEALTDSRIDGVLVMENGAIRWAVVADPEQIKSATGNRGTFDPAVADIRFSSGSKPPAPPKQKRLDLRHEPGWTMPEGSRFDDFVYRFQDKNVDLKRALGAIKAEEIEVADRFDAYLQEELFHGRAAKRTEDFAHHELTPLLREMKMRELSIDDVDAYLHARHAEEANAHIAEINPDLPDGGSGLTNAEAKAYLDGLDPAVKKRLAAVAAKVDAMIAKTRGMYAAYGLESQATTDAWGTMFEHYVPLMREDKDGAMGIGQGFSIKGREVKHRTGSTARVVDILANIAMQREKVIVRGEKNRVAVALAGLVKTNPNPAIWTFGEVPTEQVLNEQSGMVETRQKPGFKNDPNVLVAKIVAKDGSVHERAVVFNPKDERAVRMAAALKNLDAAQLEGVLGVSAKITRYFSAINTQYNPVFGVVNLIRDVQGAALNLTSTALAGHRAEILSHTLSALSGVYRDARAVRSDKAPASPWAELWEEFQNEGGQTGFRDLYRTSDDRANALKAVMDPTAWMDTGWGKFFTAGGVLKVPLALAQKGATPLFDWLSDYNQAMENAVRLAAYKVGLEQGLSKARAASLAKNLTVNFNRKGQAGQQAGALYAFFNASMQGTARMADVLFDIERGDIKTLRVSKAGQAIIGGGLLLGVVQAVALAAAGFDDDEPPQFVRERNLVIPIGQKKYLTVPMPLGWHVIPNIGRIAAELALGGGKNPGKRAAQMAGIFAEAFNPIGSAGVSLQTISPTALDPLVALAENKDWTGKPIARQAFNKATPGHALARDTASIPGIWLAHAINRISGGTEYVAGSMSPTPDQIDYLIGQVTGGVGRELSKAQQSAKALATGEDLPTHKVPLVGRFYGNADGPSGQASRFYENLNRINEHEAQIKGLAGDGNKAAIDAYRKAHPDAALVDAANTLERKVAELRRTKSMLLKRDAPRAEIKKIETMMTDAMRRFNQAVEAAQKPEKKAA